MKNKFLFLLAIIFLISASGCDYKDIDRRTFIVAIGLDINANHDLVITMKAAVPKNQKTGGNTKNNEIYTVEASSIGLGLRKIKQQLSLEPDYSHLKVLILGENFLNGTNKTSLNHLMSFFITRRDFQNLIWVVLGKPSAADILKVEPPAENYAGSDLFLRFGQGVESQYTHNTKLSRFYTQLNTPGLTPLCPIFSMKNGVINNDELAIFDRNSRLALTIGNEELKIFNLLTKKVRSGYVFSISDDEKVIGFNVLGQKIKYSFSENKNHLVCTIKPTFKLSLEEGTEYSYDNKKTTSIIEKHLNEKTKNLLKKFKDNEVDPINLELNYWQYRPKFELTEKWLTKIYPNIEYKVNTKVNIGGKSAGR